MTRPLDHNMREDPVFYTLFSDRDRTPYQAPQVVASTDVASVNYLAPEHVSRPAVPMLSVRS